MKQQSKTKQIKLAYKLTLRIALVLVLLFTCLILAISDSTKKDLISRELGKLELLASENATIAKTVLEQMVYKLDSLTAALQSSRMVPQASRVSYVSNLLEQVGSAQDDILSIFVAAGPNSMLPNTPEGLSIRVSQSGLEQQRSTYQYLEQSAYTQALASQSTTLLSSTKTIDGNSYNVVSILMPVRDEKGVAWGILGCDIDVQVFSKEAYVTGGFESFQNQIIGGAGTMIANSRDASTVGKRFVDVSVSKDPQAILQSANVAGAHTALEEVQGGSKEYRVYIPFLVGDNTTPWLSGTSISLAEFNEQITEQILRLVLYSAIGMVVMILFAYTSIRRALAPLSELEHCVQLLSEGNLSTPFHHQSNDEIGRLSTSYNSSIETLSFYVTEIDRAMGLMSSGNFDVYPSRPFIGDFTGIEQSIKTFIARMSTTLAQVQDAASAVSSGAELVSSGATALSQGATEQSSAVEELTVSIEDLTHKVRQTNQNAEIASTRVQEAGQQLEVSNQRMQEMIGAMHEITDNSSQIEKIIKTIEDIAFQTNILALNAAVEAARAGAAGKGFAVVADEVRNLAGKSSQAAKSTTEMIQRSIHSVDAGARIAAEAAGTLDIVREKAGSVVAIVDEIQRDSALQRQQIEAASVSADQISTVVQTNSATAEESAAASEELASQSQVMRGLIDQFTLNETVLAAQRTGTVPGRQVPSLRG